MTSEGELNPKQGLRLSVSNRCGHMLAHPRDRGLLCTMVYTEEATGYFCYSAHRLGVNCSVVELESVSPDHHQRATALKTYRSDRGSG